MTEIKLDKVTSEFTQEEHCMSNEMGGVETLTIECLSDAGITDADEAAIECVLENLNF